MFSFWNHCARLALLAQLFPEVRIEEARNEPGIRLRWVDHDLGVVLFLQCQIAERIHDIAVSNQGNEQSVILRVKGEVLGEPTEIDRSSQFLNLHCGSTKAAFRFPSRSAVRRASRLVKDKGSTNRPSSSVPPSRVCRKCRGLKIRFLVT